MSTMFQGSDLPIEVEDRGRRAISFEVEIDDGVFSEAT